MATHELIDLRRERSKSYIVDDVKRQHIIYTSPIHYKNIDEDNWNDINLQFKTVEDSNKLFSSDIITDNKFSVGFRKDGIVDKYIGIRRGINNQLETTPTYIEINGINRIIPSTFNEVKNIGNIKNHSFDNGELYTKITATNTTSYIKCMEYVNNFFIQEYIDITGFKILNELVNGEYIPINGTFIFESSDGEQLWISNPKMWSNGNISNFINHKLYEDGNRLVYEKTPTDEGKDWLSVNNAPIHIDADTYYSTTDDGWVWNQNIDVWDDCRTAASGTSTGTSDENGYMGSTTTDSKNDYYIIRSFFRFDTSSISGTVTSCEFKIQGFEPEVSDTPLVASVQKSAWTPTLATSDFSNFSGSYYDTITWSNNSLNTFSFNSTGISDINKSGYTSVCIREYNHDYVGTTLPDDENYVCGGYYANNATYKPYLSIEETKIDILGVSSPSIFLGGTTADYGEIMGITM